MTDDSQRWTILATYAAGYEADIAIARLDAAGITAIRGANDNIGIFGPGFEGATARGVDVLVPADAVEEARQALRA